MQFSTCSFEAREPMRLTSIFDNPAETIQSMEHQTLRPRSSSPRTNDIVSNGSKLTDYQAQADRAFEHDACLKELLARQASLGCRWTPTRATLRLRECGRHHRNSCLEQQRRDQVPNCDIASTLVHVSLTGVRISASPPAPFLS
jgi:hypothetical protein